MAQNHALLIGINKYPMLDPRYELSGCIVDVKLMKSVLQLRFGFQPQDFVELYDHDATQSAIRAAMQQLVITCQPGDCIFFHFAGHGSQRTCSDGTESSGLDSTIMPSDSGRQNKPNLDISDDEIGDWLEQLVGKTDNITLIFDCCHSGTITRDVSSATTRSVPADLRSCQDMGLDVEAKSRTRDVSGKNFLSRNEQFVVFSGCRDDELANEYSVIKDGNRLRHGALSYWLSQSMLSAKSQTTYQDIFELASQQITALFPTQHPQIEGRSNRVLFGTDVVQRIKYFTVQVGQNGAYSLNGGAAHGVVAGSKWAVYPDGTNHTEGISPLANATVTSVNAMSSAITIEPSDAELPSGARCVLFSTPVSIPKLSIDIGQLPQNTMQEIKAKLDASNLLSASEDALTADVTLTNTDLQWSALSRDEHPLIPLQPLETATDYARLIDNLETKARAQNVFALNHPQSSIKAAFVLYRSTDDGVSWEKIDANTRFVQGDRVAIEIINNDNRDLFVSVLDIGLAGKVSMFYPPGHNSEKLKAGLTLKIGFDHVKIPLFVPDNFHLSSGRETFKAMLSTDETSFSWLQQGGTRALSNDSVLQKMMEQSLQGNNTRDPIVNWGAPSEDWQGINCSFELTR